VSIASCVAAISMPAGVLIASFVRDDLALAWPFAVVTTALSVVVMWKHRGNLSRVRAGTEPKTGTKRPNNDA